MRQFFYKTARLKSQAVFISQIMPDRKVTVTAYIKSD